MSNINFDNPWLLLAGIPLLLLVLVPFVIAVRKENKNIHNVLALICQVLIVVAATLALAGMNYDAMITETNIFVLADVSHSADNNLDVVDGYVQSVQANAPKNSKISLIAFGRDHQVLSDFDEELVSVKTADQVDTSATNFAGVLDYAAAMFDDDVIKRIVVITDGKDTVGGNELTAVVNKLKEKDIYIDTVYLDNNIAEDVAEIQLTNVQYAGSVFMGKQEQAQLQINSNNAQQTSVFVDVTCNGKTTSHTATLYKGENFVSVPLDTTAAGTFAYTISLRPARPEEDTSPYNNACIVTQRVTERVGVLFVGGSDADCRAGEKIYGSQYVEYLSNPEQVPYSVEELCRYDEIVLCNFDVRTMKNSQAFVSNLNTTVSKFGKTLTTFGNNYVQETMAEPNETLEALGGMLPVTMGNADQDARLVTFLLDISYSTNFFSRLAVAREAVQKLLLTLNENDYVMVLGFSGDNTTVYSCKKLRDKEAVADAIVNQALRNGTNFKSGLSYAKEKLDGQRFRHRELVIISDGLFDAASADDCVSEAKEMTAQNIVISALDISMGSDLSGSGSRVLERVVKNSSVSGKNAGYYKTIESPSDIDFVIADIVEEQTEVRIENGEYTLTMNRPQESVLSGVSHLGKVKGFWYSGIKSGAVPVVTAKYNKDKLTTLDVPIYAYWSFGEGRVASFLSDISGNWISNWDLNAEKSSELRFLTNIRTSMLPDEQSESPFVISTATVDGVTKVTVQVSAFHSDATLSMTLRDPAGGMVTKNLFFDSENYVCQFDTDMTGRYDLHLQYDYATFHYEVDRSFQINYYPEYDSFTTYNVASLYRLISENGQVSVDGQLEMDNSDSATQSYTFSFIVPLMVFCAVLFLIDVFIRLIRWKDIRSLFVHEQKRIDKQSN